MVGYKVQDRILMNLICVIHSYTLLFLNKQKLMFLFILKGKWNSNFSFTPLQAYNMLH